MGHGLVLRVKPSGAKSWVQRLVLGGKRRDLGLGKYPDVSLGEALRAACANRTGARDKAGGHSAPAAPKPKAVQTPTFRESAAQHFRGHSIGLNPVHAQNWWASLENHAFPFIGDLPVDAVANRDIIRMLSRIWVEKHKVAKDVRHRVRAVFNWAISHEYTQSNPAGEQIGAALPKPRRVIRHFEALHYSEVSGALAKLEASTASPAVKLCVKWTVLTACRSREARLATWSEIDLEKGVWVIPGERMKGGIEHRQPLSAASMMVLRYARKLHKGTLLFPSPKRGPLSHATMLKALRACGALGTETLHGFRSSFRSWAGEWTDSDHAVMELCLAHSVGSQVERAYFRTDLLDKRRCLLDQWAGYLAS